jgi:hypothetical protein
VTTQDLSFNFEFVGAEPSTGTYQHTGVFEAHVLRVRYRLDHAEHVRRVRLRLGAVTDERTLAALLAVPDVELGRIPRRFGATLKRAESAQLAVLLEDPEGGQWGQRTLRVPLEVMDIEVSAPEWSLGSAIAHQWAGYASRLVRLQRDTCDDLALTEASYWGIGIATAISEEPLVRWRFAEQVYEQFLLLTSGLT